MRQHARTNWFNHPRDIVPDTSSITIVKKFTYRGKREEFSNKYHFSGTTPANEAAWKTLADAMIAVEKTTVHTGVTFVRAYGYEAGNELSVAQIDYEAAPLTPVAGTLAQSSATGLAAQPESAVTIRWRTPDRNSRKKWIYLRKYYHGTVSDPGGDLVATNAMAAFTTWANKLTDGTLPGGFKYCGPQGAVAGPMQVNPYFTTRELTRRGKRPSR